MDTHDSYAEYLVKRRTDSIAYLLKGLMALLILAAVWFLLTGGLPGLIIGAVLVVGAYFAYLNSGIEYEYLFVEGQLTVDKVLARSRRKTVFTCTVEEMETLSPTGSDPSGGGAGGRTRRLDYSSGNRGRKTYTLVCNKGNETCRVVFEPNDHMLQCFRRSAPRKVTL